MAEAVVSFAVERLESLLTSEVKFLHGVKEQIEGIQTELKLMKCFLKDADARQRENDSVRKCVAEIRELARRAEDVIEIYAVEVASKKETTSSRFKEIIRRFVYFVREGVTLHTIGSEIERLKGKLSSLTTILQRYGIRSLQEGESSNAGSMRRQHSRISYSHLIEKDFVGMEKEIENLVSLLTKKGNECEVISILGMGGQGKTTLARKIYNHTEVRTYFQAFAWVCITQQFERKEVLQSILKQLLPEKDEEISRMEDGKLVGELHKIIQQEKACLVVVDDIWKLVDWKELAVAFPVGLNTIGSKIMLTTRIEEVAREGLPHKLEGLSEEEGWQLLLNKAFPTQHGDAEQTVNSDMEKIGRDMVRRCQGLPLAISTLGGLLKGKTLKDWAMINKDIASYLNRGDGINEDEEYGTVNQILALSYDNLPHRLRHCFLYLGKFKEDEEVRAEDLVLLWLAEGFVSLEDQLEGETMLDVAERYLGNLAQRSLVQVELIKPEDVGNTWSKFGACRVHDLFRALCMSKGKEEDFLDVIDFQRKKDLQPLNSKYTAGGNRARILGIHTYNDTAYIPSLVSFAKQHEIRHVRSLVFHGFYGNFRVWPEKQLSVQEFKLVRVLTLESFDFTNKKFSAARKMGELVYLKFLSFRNCKLEKLPSSVGNLRHLETLDLIVDSAISIPNVLWKLKKLKHLYLPDPLYRRSDVNDKLRFDGLSELELLYNFDTRIFHAGGLTELSKLQIFSVMIGTDLQDLTGIINFINRHHLRYSRVAITINCDVGSEEEFSLWKLVFGCPYLYNLEIRAPVGALPSKEFVHHMSFSQTLTRVYLVHCKLEEDPMIFLEKLPNLRILDLLGNSYIGEEMRCSAIGFPQLRRLWLMSFPNLTKWTVDEGAMPNLFELGILWCENLEMLPEGLKYISSLQRLEITCESEVLKDKIRIEGEDFYKVRHIRSIFLYGKTDPHF